MSIFDSIEEAAKVFGSAGAAVPGLVWDTAQLGGDVLDQFGPDVSPGSAREHFGDVVHHIGDVWSPMQYVSYSMWHGLNTLAEHDRQLYSYGVARPLSTTQTQFAAVGASDVPWDLRMGHWGVLFDRDSWKRAWDISDTRSPGRAAFMAASMAIRPEDRDVDPMARPAADEIVNEHPILGNVLSGAVDTTLNWYGDPLWVVGKGLKGARILAQARKVTEADYATGISNLVDTEKAKFLGLKSTGLSTRVEDLFGAADVDGRVLKEGVHAGKNWHQILLLHPELKDTGAGPTIAALYERAAKIADPVMRINSQKLIYRTTLNDAKALDEIANQITANEKLIGEAPAGMATDDLYQLANTVKGGVSQPELAPMLDSEATRYFDVPQIADHLGNQAMALPGMDHLAMSKAALDENTAVLQQIQGLAGTLTASPLRSSVAGRRALRRAEGHGVFRDTSTATGIKAVDRLSDKALPQLADRLHMGTSIYQSGFFSVPVTAWMPKVAAGVFHSPASIADSFRNFMPPGWVNPDDPTQLAEGVDDMLRKAGMSFTERSEIMRPITAAPPGSAQLQAAVKSAEVAAQRKLYQPYAKGDETDADVVAFMDQVASIGQGKRAAYNADARTYSSAEHPEIPDLRADLFRDDSGNVIAMPLFESQKVNQIPLLDSALLRQTLKRNNVRIKELATEWSDLRRSLPPDSSIAAHTEKARETIQNQMDFVVQGADEMMRVWKFAALFRIPAMTMRNITEGTARMYAALGSASYLSEVYGPGVRNFGYNTIGRRFDYRNQLRELRGQETSAKDLLESMDHVKLDEAEKRLIGLQKRIAAYENQRGSLGAEGQLPIEMHPISEETYKRDKQQAEVLLNQNPELSLRVENRAKLDDATQALREFRKNKKIAVPKKQLLDEEEFTLPGGQTMESYGGGKSGPIYVNEASADDSAARLYFDSIDERLRGFESGSDWRTRDVLQDGPEAHLDYWHGVVNKQVAHSELTKAYLEGGRGEQGVDAIVRYLTRTTAGRNLGREFPFWAHDPKDWANRVGATVEHLIPRDAAVERQILASGKVSKMALARAVPNPMIRPTVHAPSADVSMGHTGILGQWTNKQMNRYFRTVVAKPETHMVRHPFVKISYRRKATELAEGLYKQKGPGSTLTTEELERIAHVARGHALNQMRRTLFDVASRSEAAQNMRLMSPFFMAWQDTMTKWARMMYNDPALVARFRQVFDAPVRAGIVVDQNGHPVGPGEKVSDSHYLIIPGLDKIPGLTDVSLPIPQSSFNLVLQGGGFGNPGAGPMLQIPATVIANDMADDPGIEKDLKMILPYGPSLSAREAALPGWLNRAVSVLSHDQRYQQSYSQLVQSRYVDFRLKYHRDPNLVEQKQILASAMDDNKHVAWLRLIISGTQPFAPVPDSRFAAQLDLAHRLEQRAADEGHPWHWVTKKFVEEVGPAYLPLLKSSSNQIGNLDANAGTIAGIKRHRGLLDQIDPSMFGVVIGPYSKDGAYYKPAQNYLATHQAQPGAPEHFYDYTNPAEAMRAQVVDDGWTKYRRLVNGLNARAYAMGLASYVDSPQLIEEKAQLQRRLAKNNPSWWSDFNSYNEADFETQTVNSLRTIAKDRKLAGDVARTDIGAIRRYLKVRDSYKTMLMARDRAGGSADPDAISNTDIMLQYTAVVSRIMSGNTYFEDFVWTGHVEHDPMLVDTNTPVTATATSSDPEAFTTSTSIYQVAL